MPAGHEEVFHKFSVQIFYHQTCSRTFLVQNSVLNKKLSKFVFVIICIFPPWSYSLADSILPLPSFNANIPAKNQPISSFEAQKVMRKQKDRSCIKWKSAKGKKNYKMGFEKKRSKPSLFKIFLKGIYSFASRGIQKIQGRSRIWKLKTKLHFERGWLCVKSRAAHWALPQRPNHFRAIKIRFVSMKFSPCKYVKACLMIFRYGAVV